MKITASTLDSFRLYKEFDFKSLEELEKQIKGEPITVTPEMKLGKAYDKLVCTETFPPESNEIDGFIFDLDTAKQTRQNFESCLFQVWASEYLILNGGKHYLIGRADAILFNVIYDLKTRTSPFNLENYQDSLQWQFYCFLFGLKKFVYRLVNLECISEIYMTSNVQDLPLYFDNQNETNLYEWIREFVSFCRSRGLNP